MLRQKSSHDDVAILFRARVLAITTVKFVGHPLGEMSFVRLDSRHLLGVVRDVDRNGVGKLARQRFAALEPLRSKAKCGGLKTGIARGHADDCSWRRGALHLRHRRCRRERGHSWQQQRAKFSDRERPTLNFGSVARLASGRIQKANVRFPKSRRHHR